MNIYSVVYLLGHLLLAPVAGAAVSDVGCPVQADPNNKYTLAATHKKIQKKHPQIQAASPTTLALRRWCAQQYKNVGGIALKMDIFAPAKAPTPAPAIVMVHGGGWRSGSRDLYHTLAGRLAAEGFVVATVSYRLAHEARYPAAVHDIRDAVRWLRTHAEKFGVDAEKIAIAGGSAGGQMASLVALTTGDKALDLYAETTPELGAVAAIVVIDGLSSFTVPLALKHENDPRKKPSSAEAWFGGRYEQVPHVWRQASPLEYASPQAPPMLFLNSGRPRFTAGQAEIVKKLARYQVKSLPASPHSFWLFEPWMTPTVSHISEFLKAHFKR